MRALLPWDISQSLAGVRIDHHRVSASRNKQPMRSRINCEVIPRALSADGKGFGDVPLLADCWQKTRAQHNGQRCPDNEVHPTHFNLLADFHGSSTPGYPGTNTN